VTNEPATNNPPDTLAAALNLANRGFPIIPIRPKQKHPPMAAWQHAATTNPETLANWFGGLYRNHGLGVATGHNTPQNPDRYLFVLDIDEHNAETSGGDTLHELCRTYGQLPTTVEAHTGSGGRHLYFTSPAPLRNDAGRKLGAGIDIRGEGGQVLAPPTIHPNGNPYVWDLENHPDTTPVAHAPQWLIALLETPAAPPPVSQPTTMKHTANVWHQLGDDGPAATYNNQTTWPQLLETDGWTLHHTDTNGEQHWTRPGKTTREGTSATVGYKNTDALTVFTSAIPWLPEGAYSRFGYYACRNHNGDRSAAARELRQTQQPTTTTTIVGDTLNNDEPWPQPIPLHDTNTPPTFPLDTLPEWIRNHVEQTATDLQVSADLPATLALGALSVAALGATRVNYPRQRWTQPLNLYAAVALPPSAGKSPAKNAMFAPLETLEQQRLRNAATTKMRNETERNILEKRRKTFEDKAAKGGDDGTAAMFELLDITEQIAQLEHAPSGRLLADDATTEALGVALAEAGGNIAVVSAEGGLFDRIAGMYSDGPANLDLYLEGWSGGRYVVDRIKRDPINIPAANLVVVTTVQPTVLDAIGNSKNLTGRGLVARFLLCQPANNVGTRDRLRHTTGDDRTVRAYEAHLTEIAEHLHTNPTTTTIENDTSDMFAQWDQQLENRGAPGAELEHLNEWTGKLRASVLRIAALLHHANHHTTTTIDTTTMANAIEIGNYYLEHARHIADRWGTDDNIKQARRILEWFTRTNADTFTVRDLYSANRRTFPTADDTRQPLELLHERGWIRPLFDGPLVIGRRGKDSPRFAIHPSCAPCARPTTPTNDTDPTNGNAVARHARHARTPPGGKNGAIGEMPSRGITTSPPITNNTTNPPPPSAHGAHGAQPPQNETPPPPDDLGLF
jgi:hypothetical protein